MNIQKEWKNLKLPHGAETHDLRDALLAKLVPANLPPPPLPPVIISSDKFTLRSFEYSQALSRETNAFAADVWFQGKRIAHARNDGGGGCTFVAPYDGKHELYGAFREWSSSLPFGSCHASEYRLLSQLIPVQDRDFTFFPCPRSTVELVDDWVSWKLDGVKVKAPKRTSYCFDGKHVDGYYTFPHPVPRDHSTKNTIRVPVQLMKETYMYYPCPHRFGPRKPVETHDGRKGVTTMRITDFTVEVLLDEGGQTVCFDHAQLK